MKPTIESYRLDRSTSIDFEDLEAKSRSGDEEAFDEMSRELLKKKSWKKIPMREYDDQGNLIENGKN